MRPLRIVLEMGVPPLPFGNSAGRGYYVILRGLIARGHKVTALALCSDQAEIEQAQALFPRPDCDLRCYLAGPRAGIRGKLRSLRKPLLNTFSADFRRDLERELFDGADVVHLDEIWAGWLALQRAESVLLGVHCLTSIDLAESRGLRARLERSLLARGERRLLGTFRFFRTCSARLAQCVRRLNPEAQAFLVPDGLDPSLYRYTPDEQRPRQPVVSLVGSMNWMPSYSAAVRLLTRLYPEIRQAAPEARFEIVGRAARRALGAFVGLPAVEIYEDVPDIQPFFERATLLLYPCFSGTGMKVKVAEAMAFGVPVVTTSEGIEGLPAQDGVHALIADDDPGLIERTVALLKDVPRQNRLRRAARQLVETACGPSAVLDALEQAYLKVRASATGRA